MKKLSQWFAIILAVASTAFAKPGDPITYSITLVASSYDAVSDTTQFTYAVTSNPGGGPAISHWVIGFDADCGGAAIIAGSNDALVSWNNSDPTTGVRGIKFDTGYNDRETRLVSLALNGAWATGEVTIAVKSGNGFVLGSVSGPICGGVVEPTTYTLSGQVFFDLDFNGALGTDEFGLGGITVTLLDGESNVVATTITAEDGSYTFTELDAGDYVVVIGGRNGLEPTTATRFDVSVSADTGVADAGLALNFDAIGAMSANGFTIGYWKNNLAKALAGKTKGIQVSASTLAACTAIIAELGLEPFDGMTMSGAEAIMSATGSAPSVLLAKQLMGSEFNYANGAYLNGDEEFTYLFVVYGEYVLKHAAELDASYVLSVKDWFDAYNNTHGGVVLAQ